MKRWIRNVLIAVLVIFPVLFIVASYLEDLVETGGQEGTGVIIALITGLPTGVINLASSAGYLGVFSLMLLESAAFPVPSEVILPLAGYLVFRGTLQYWPVVFYSTAAALIGSFVDYYIGRRLGSQLVTGRIRVAYIPVAELQKVQAWFDAHGPMAVALFRLVPTARVLISFPAGACRMSLREFACYTLLGCLPWNMALVYLGWWLGFSWQTATSFFRYFNLVFYSVLIIFVLWIVWRAAVNGRKGVDSV
jgi:membrane protein DedA with SNARE-associated domain